MLDEPSRARGGGPTEDSEPHPAHRAVIAGEVLAAAEQWQPGDIVLAADRDLWCRADPHSIAQGWPWAAAPSYAPSSTTAPEGSVDEQTPVRPVTA